MAKILKLFSYDLAVGGHVWLIGIATCAIYFRCKIQHSTMGNDWYLQALPISPKAWVARKFSAVWRLKSHIRCSRKYLRKTCSLGTPGLRIEDCLRSSQPKKDSCFEIWTEPCAWLCFDQYEHPNMRGLKW
ncbi:hypothetical protein J5N97_004002 [Dioscorea zingiberensis]|uniref:SMAX1-like nucleotide binding domain-containing protein n=1 Tax=Dioscorea zingiberensis TaxID=325984 RepID=A0A9D5D5P5_9LILI|nr:hypothetical protein J5N97_004002 [Dioscorea zingiberensis]